MPCYSPLRAFLVKEPEGKRLVFSQKHVPVGKYGAFGADVVSLPCGHCIGCRLERARQWGVRVMHEAQMHDSNSFLLLSYNDEHLPSKRSLCVRDCQLFLKKLRSRLASKRFCKRFGINPKRVRFFMSGEYGEDDLRPHYHCILFGEDFAEAPWSRVFSHTRGDHRVYRSDLLNEIWGKGFVWIGSVTFDSAVYVAKYAVKKIYGPKAKAHYGGRDPEFLLMSRGGRTSGGENARGIGYRWYKEFGSDVYPSDEVIVNGHQTRPPRYYDKLVSEEKPEVFEPILARREAQASKLESFVYKGREYFVAPSCNAKRLVVRRRVAEAKARLKTRTL